VATSRRNPRSRARPSPHGEAEAEAAGRESAQHEGLAVGDPGSGSRSEGMHRLPPVRLAPRDELAASARVAPLLRAARDVARWASTGRRPTAKGTLRRADAAAAAAEFELTPAEVDAAFRVATATRMLVLAGGGAGPGDRVDVLASGTAEDVLAVWDEALSVMLDAEDLDGMATALYTVGGPVRMDSLFEAYLAAAGSRPQEPGPADGPGGQDPGGEDPGGEDHRGEDHGGQDHGGEDHRGQDHRGQDHGAALSSALETLADLGVVELDVAEPGTDDSGSGLTVTLSRLGVWGVHRRLRAQGWHVPVLGGGARGDAAALLATLASCDVEDGEAEIAMWLAARSPHQAAAELIDAASHGSPGLRGAGFAVLDRIGEDAVAAVRAALDEPVLRAHAAVWLHEHGEDAELRREDRAWLLVDLGAGLLEEADPQDVVAELLPDVPPDAQAELVAGLWKVSHPGVTDLLTALSDHHPDPAVARAARKAAFKARSSSAVVPPGS
jgi:hypothetical protein